MTALNDLRARMMEELAGAEAHLGACRERADAADRAVELIRAQIFAHDAAVAAMIITTDQPTSRARRRNIKAEVTKLLDDVPRTPEAFAAAIGSVRVSAVEDALAKLRKEGVASADATGAYVLTPINEAAQ